MAYRRKITSNGLSAKYNISLASGNLVSQLDSIKKSAKLTEDQIDDILTAWNNLEEDVKTGAITQNKAYDEMREKLLNYGIGVSEVNEKLKEQKDKVKEVETQSNLSIKNAANDQKELKKEVDLVNEALMMQATLLNSFRAKATNNKLTSANVDALLTRIGTNLQGGKSQDSIRNSILDYIGYTGTYDTEVIRNVYKAFGLNDIPASGKYNYGSDIVKGLKNNDILRNDRLTDVLAMAILNQNEFDKYAKSQPNYDELYSLRDQYYGRIWGNTFKGNLSDIDNMTDIADRWLNRANENRDRFMSSLRFMPPATISAFSPISMGKHIFNAYEGSNITKNALKIDTAANQKMLPAVVEAVYRDVSENVDKIAKSATETALVIQNNKSQIDNSLTATTQAMSGLRQRIGHFVSFAAATFSKIGRDMSLTFRDFGNSIRTMSSVMYSAIHLAQALENTMEISDSMTSMSYRLKRYDTSGASRQALLNKTFDEAQQTRSDVDSFGTLTQRILATGVTNGDAQEAMRIASLITKTMVLGGSTAQEQRSATLQLSQGLASNILGGDELRAIRENAIGFTEMLAKGLTRGYQQGVFTEPSFQNVQIGDLKGLGKKGLLTADVVTKAISLMEDEINKDFEAMPELFSQTMNKLVNTFKKRLNEFNNEGKGLGRIVKLFQDLEKWIDSDRGKVVLDKLMNALDKFIDFLTKTASYIGGILDSPIGDGLLKALELYLNAKPIMMGAEVLFGKTDMYGNQRAGLLGYGGAFNIATRLAQGGGIASLFSAENVNGTNVAIGGLLGNAATLGIDLINTITGRNYGSAFASKVAAQTALNRLLSNGDRMVNVNSVYHYLKDTVGIKQAVLDNWLYEHNMIGAGGKIFGTINNGTIAQDLLNNNVLSSGLVGNTLSTTAGTSVGNAVTGAMAAKGGLIGKALGVAAAHPIATAIVAALGVGVVTRNHFDKKKDDEQLDSFLSRLPEFNNLTGLQAEDRTALRSKAVEWYKSHTSGAFIGTRENWTEGEYQDFLGKYYQEAMDRHEKYYAQIAKNTEETATNTASTLDITDEFIRNMNDIRTRQFRGEILMGGNGSQHTWNVTVHNESDIKNIAEQIQQAVIAAEKGMMTGPVTV